MRNYLLKIPLLALLFIMMVNASANPVAEPLDPDCQKTGGYGPFDYRTASQGQRELVEYHHFHQHYAAYLKGKSLFQLKREGASNPIEAPAAGFNYTLNAFPNHPKALAAVEDLGYRKKVSKVPAMPMRVHCYFQRAVRLAPDDGLVRAIYGYYYARRNQPAEARVQLAQAVELKPDDVNVMTFVASAYLEIKDLDQAQIYATKAYTLGYPLPGLRHRLEKAGRRIEQPMAKESP